MRVGLTFPDEAMPRTIFYDRFIDSLQRSSSFVADDVAADVVFPFEDTSSETNWPRYGNADRAFLRGSSFKPTETYLRRLAKSTRPVCIVNMNPFLRLPILLSDRPYAILAEGCLPIWERSMNPRTISMPSLPLNTPVGASQDKTIFASFRGVLSHPSRAALHRLHDGNNYICELVAADNHADKFDATSGDGDRSYADLMARSLFAFVPRGDALFSYRLLEALAFGCIPVVLSDGWVLPFDRTISWGDAAVSFPEAAIPEIPYFLEQFKPGRIAALQRGARAIYAAHFATMDSIVTTLIAELEAILKRRS